MLFETRDMFFINELLALVRIRGRNDRKENAQRSWINELLALVF
jgi:hypothetical protein